MPSQSVRVCVPGEKLGSSEEIHAGSGTYARHGFIFASLAGVVEETQQGNEMIISVRSKHEKQILPQIGSIVTCKVVGITARAAKCLITAVNNCRISEPFRGVIRREDVRAKDLEKVEIARSYRPGDCVLAKILSLGDASSYLLTTAENGLGVVLAKSRAGEMMIPVGWQEMQCPASYLKEPRKVARPHDYFLKS